VALLGSTPLGEAAGRPAKDFAVAGTAELSCNDSSGQPGRQSGAVVTAIPVTSIVKP
jgi:hypothetical protein